jgi:guanylate kinase
MQDKPLVIVLSGPSGVGKDATIASLKHSGARFHYVVTATTREKRKNENDGVDYYFLSEDDFKKKIGRDEFLEYAEVYGNYYGVLKKEVKRALEKGEDVILKVDVQGAETLKRKIPDAVFIFLVPPSIDDLAIRLANRNTDSQKDLKIRINKALEEMKRVSIFDYQVINYRDDLEMTTGNVRSIVQAERCRVIQRNVVL